MLVKVNFILHLAFVNVPVHKPVDLEHSLNHSTELILVTDYLYLSLETSEEEE